MYQSVVSSTSASLASSLFTTTVADSRLILGYLGIGVIVDCYYCMISANITGLIFNMFWMKAFVYSPENSTGPDIGTPSSTRETVPVSRSSTFVYDQYPHNSIMLCLSAYLSPLSSLPRSLAPLSLPPPLSLSLSKPTPLPISELI